MKDDLREKDIVENLKSTPQEGEFDHPDMRDIKADAESRSKKQPILQRIIKSLSNSDKTFRELILSSEPMERRLAMLEDGILQKFEHERCDDNNLIGAIFKGKIQNLEGGLKAAFVDIGREKNAFLHYWDMMPAADAEYECVKTNSKDQQKSKITLADIPEKYPIGTEIMVQITKGEIGTKGPRVTTNIAIPGRFLVLMPFSDECGVSKKIEDFKERDRLREILNKMTIPEGFGVIIRTAGIGKKIRYFIRDLHMLLQTWNDILSKKNSTNKPVLLYKEPDMVERTVRDFLTEEIDRVIVNNKNDYERVYNSVAQISPRSKSKIHYYDEIIPIFDRFNVERQIEQTFKHCVPLPSGGEIVINENEALTSIDINTGSYKLSENDENKNYIFNVNYEAGKEICRQIRLRNIGGLVVVDFVDMKSRRDRNKIYELMRDEMYGDRAKCHVLPISQLGLMELSRQRHSQSNIRENRCECPYCNGDGFVKNARAMSGEIQRKLLHFIQTQRAKGNSQDILDVKIYLHPSVLERMRTSDEAVLLQIQEEYHVKLSFRADAAFHIERFKIIEE